MSARAGAVARSVLEGHAVDVAPSLLGTLLVVGGRVGRIVEVEAYGGADDPASHAHRGPTARNASMFARAGTLYCYRSYGIHTCANVVTGAVGEGQAVLLRAVEPIEGLDDMRRDRPAARRDRDLTNGPGKLCQAMGITLDHDGLDLCDPRSAVRLVAQRARAAGPVVAAGVVAAGGEGADAAADAAPVRASGRRVGITRAAERPWRFWIDGSPHVSPHRAGAEAAP